MDMKDRNISYLGLLQLLRTLREMGAINSREAQKIAARLKVETGADVIVTL